MVSLFILNHKTLTSGAFMEKGARKEADPDHGHERAAQLGHIFWFVCFGLRWVVVTV